MSILIRLDMQLFHEGGGCTNHKKYTSIEKGVIELSRKMTQKLSNRSIENSNKIR